MTTQNFYGPVAQVAGRDVRNEGGEGGDPNGLSFRGQRWNELVARQEEHLEQRAAAERRRWANIYVPWMVLGTVLSVWMLWNNYLFRDPAWLFLLVPGIGIFLPSLFLQPLLRRCAQDWRYHNDAIGEINKALHVL